MKTIQQRAAGMGAIPLKNGTAFRVWAPHAEAVSVIGTFNDWQADQHPLTSESNGFWYTEVEQANMGDGYKFSIMNGDQKFERIDPYARQVTNSVGHGIIHDPTFDWGDDTYELPAWNELVIYEMHIGTFVRHESDKPGTFYDAISKLDYLKNLGVNVLQVMPVAEFAGDISWGYNPAHIFALESAYGGPNGLKEFVKQAHSRGMGVIIDVVYNHFGPSDLDLWRFDGWSENEKGGIYFYNDDRAHTPWGDTRPDYGRGEVRAFIRDNAMMWLDDYHVDGLRYDMTLYIRSIDGTRDIPEGWSLTQWINRSIRESHPRAITIAEDLQNNDYLTRTADDGGAGFGSQWDAGFVHPIRDVLIQPDDASRSMEKVRDALTHQYNGDGFQRVIYTESHDEVANGKARVPEEITQGDPQSFYARKRSSLGAGLVLTAPGIPMLFQGQEFLQGKWFTDTAELDWNNRKTFQGIVHLYGDLIRLRLNRSGVTAGLTGSYLNVFHVNEIDKVVAYHRQLHGGPGDDVVVVANFSHQTFEGYRIGFPTAGVWKVRVNTDWQKYSEDFENQLTRQTTAEPQPQDGLPLSAPVNLGPYSLLILSQDRPAE